MATRIDMKSLSHAKQEPFHFIPCEIHHDGNADIGNFFLTTIDDKETTVTDTNENKEYTATFRGRPLNGQKLNVPSGYTGLVLNEPNKRVTEEEDRRLVVSHTFNEFTHWNLDRQPSQDDPIQRAFQWIDISSAIHKPVELGQDANKSE